MANDNQLEAILGTQGAGSPVAAVEPQASNDLTEKPLSRLEVEKLIAEHTSKQFRAIQSMQDKQETRLKSELQTQLDALKKAGVELTPEQAAVVQQSIKERIGNDDVGEAEPQVAQPEPQQNPIVGAAMKIMDKYGVKLEQGDPELAMVNNQTQDPGEFLASVVDAVLAKRDRTGQENALKNGKVPAIAGVGMASGALPNDLPSTDYFKMGYKK